MDLLDYSTTEKSLSGARMAIMRPGTDDPARHKAKGDKEEREMFLLLLGPESPEFKRGVRQAQNREAKRKSSYTPSDEDIEGDRRADCKWLASLTVGGLAFLDGKWLEPDRESAFDLYYRVAPVRGQALTYVMDQVNFTKG